MRPDTIVFLGAGASAQDGAPTQRQVITEFRDYYNKRFSQKNKIIEDYFLKYFGIDLLNEKNDRFPTFEEMLGIIDLAISRNESFSGSNNTNPFIELKEQRLELIYLIGKTLERSLRRHTIYHDKMIGTLEQQEALDQTVFISTNYDILIDNAVSRYLRENQNSNGENWKSRLNYGVNVRDLDSKGDIKLSRTRLITILKLHGSLSWLYCTTCNILHISYDRKGGLQAIKRPTLCTNGSCNTRMYPIIIPPSYFKAMSNFHLLQIWKQAENYLKSSKRVIFCGYSLPEADIHIKYLLKRAEVNRKENDLKIYLFNKNPTRQGYSTDNSTFENYTRFFKRSTRIIDTKEPFSTFCERGVRFLEELDNRVE